MDIMDRRDGNQPSPNGPEKDLRRRAEDRARAKNPDLQHSPGAMSLEALRQTLHELQVHQIELEMQNEELRRTQMLLDVSQTRYFDLYDMSPVGYCTVNAQGIVLEANAASSKLLGLERSALLGQPISRFIVPSSQDTYYLCRKQLEESGISQGCELQMVKSDGACCWVELSTRATKDEHGAPQQYMVLHDVTEAKIMAEAMRESEARYRALAEQLPKNASPS